jgi:hypothetical protein
LEVALPALFLPDLVIGPGADPDIASR